MCACVGLKGLHEASRAPLMGALKTPADFRRVKRVEKQMNVDV